MEIANPDAGQLIITTRPNLKTCHMPTTIECFPAELLCAIFDESFEIFKLEERGQPELADPPWHFISNGLTPSLQPTSNLDRLQRFKSPSRFPYGLATVCQFWKEVLSMRPIFWQQAILFLGSPLTTGNTGSVFDWSRNLPIDVVILRENPDKPAYLDFNEESRVKAITNLLYPHLTRCRSIYLETKLGSSLPLISERIRGCSLILSSLSLSCQVGDTVHQRQKALGDGGPPLNSQTTLLPHLKSLVIDGKNFDNTYTYWLRLQTNLEQLVISNYPFSCYGVSLGQTLGVIQHLPNLLRLKLQNVDFDIDPGLRPGTYNSTVRDLHLEAVSHLITQELFRLCDFDELDSVCFAHCVVEDFPYSNLLILDDVRTNSDVPLDVLLSDWEGPDLWIGNCQGFNNDIFDMFRKFDLNEEEFKCPWMEKLYLSHLPAFSLKKLKKMIKRRNQHINYDDPDWADHTDFGPAIKSLSIESCDVRELTTQDIEWFTSHVVEFTYIQ